MMADIFNKPVHIKQGSGSDSVAYGSLLVSATQIGLYKNLDEAAEAVKLPDSFFPNEQHHQVHMKHFSIFEKLSVKLFDEFEEIAKLQDSFERSRHKQESISNIKYCANETKNSFDFFYGASAILLIVWTALSFTERYNAAGWLLMFFFLCIAIVFRGNRLLKGLSYTMVIIGLVSFAMYFPQYFITIGNFKLSALIIPLLQIIMFGMGTELSLKDFMNVVRMPKGIIVGVIFHYIIMPSVAFGDCECI